MHFPIQLPIANRLSQMRGLDTLATRQIRNRARHAQNPVHRPCGKLQTFNRLLK